MKKLGAIPLSPDILGKSNIGLWAFELDEGQPPRMYVDDTMLGLIGLTEQKSPEETYHAWYDHIDPNHLDEVAASVEKMTAGTHAEVQYPWYHPDGRTVIVRCGGVRNFSYTKGIRIEGCHQDVTAVMHYQKNNTEEWQGIQSFFNLLLGEYVSAYYVNLKDYSMIVYHRTQKLHEEFDGIDNYLESVQIYINERVHPDDRAAMLDAVSPDSIRKKLAETSTYHLLMRDISNGESRWFLFRVSKGFDDDHAVFTFRDITSTRKEQEDKRKLQNIFNEFGAEYEFIIYANADTKNGDIFHLRAGDHIHTRLFADNIFERFADILKSAVCQEDLPSVLKHFTEENIRKQLSESSSFTVPFRMQKEGKTLYYSAVFRRAADENGMMCFVTGIKNIDEETRRDLAEKEQLQHNMEIIGGLTSEYTALYRVNLDTGTYVNYAISDRLKDTQDLFSRFTTFKELYLAFIYSSVHPDDHKQLLRFADMEYVRKVFSHRKSVTLLFRRNYNGKYLWTEQIMVKFADIDEEPSAVAIGFIEKDADVRARKEAELEKEKRTRILDAIGDAYLAIYQVNFKTDTVIPFKVTPSVPSEFARENVSYTELTQQWIETTVHPDDRETMRNLTSPAFLKKRFSEKKSFYAIFRTMVNGNMEYHELRVIRSEDFEKSGAVVVGFMNRDEDIKQTIQLKKKVEEGEELSIILQAMAEDFECLLHVDFDTGKEDHYRHSEPFTKAIPNWLDETDYRRRVAIFAERIVIADDREYFMQAADPDVVSGRIKDGDPYYIKYRINLDGKETWFETKFLHHSVHVGHNCALVGFRNIDAVYRAEMEQQEHLKQALEMAKSASRAKTTFLNSMSHDIRTPMNAIIGYTGLVAAHLDSPELVRDYLSKITQSSDHLLSLINDVLDMSRIESGKMVLNDKEENISDIIHTLRNIVQADVHAKNLDFFVDCENIMHEYIFCDKLRLNQVLLNVLSNAIKYTPAGGTITLNVREAPSSDTGYSTYTIVIKDNGIGMSEEFLKTIFDPFTRVSSSTVSGIQGTGLGMAITKSIIEMMNGRIDIHSRENEGTEVILNFDFEQVNSPQEELSYLSSLKGMRSIVVDDNTDTCEHAAKMLRDIGMRSEWCTSGQEVIVRTKEALKNNDLFKVYIIDWVMPDVNGLETTRRLRKIIGNEAPIIIITAYEWGDIEKEARDAGVSGFVSKPLFPSDLRRILKTCCSEETTPAPEKEVEYHFEGKKILLVEDNEMNREIAEDILTENAFVVDTAEDGSIAVEKMKQAAPGTYDLILMDIQMPILDGYEATRAIRALDLEYAKTIPIIAMTANAFEEDRLKALDAGMNEHIPKPVDVKKLKETIARFIV